MRKVLHPHWVIRMNRRPPTWLEALEPRRQWLAPLKAGTHLEVWHAEIELEAWRLPAGCALSGSDNWNGEALVLPRHPNLERSIGEIEVVERLRAAFPADDVYWTAGSGNPPRNWQSWALRSPLRGPWFLSMEATVRRRVAQLLRAVREERQMFCAAALPLVICMGSSTKGPVPQVQRPWTRSRSIRQPGSSMRSGGRLSSTITSRLSCGDRQLRMPSGSWHKRKRLDSVGSRSAKLNAAGFRHMPLASDATAARGTTRLRATPERTCAESSSPQS